MQFISFSMERSSHQYSENGYFHDIGIDNIDGTANHGEWQMKRLKSIIKLLGHEKVTSVEKGFLCFGFVWNKLSSIPFSESNRLHENGR